MSTVLAHTGFMTARHARNLIRQPWYVAFTLFIPVVYLVLFSQLFESVSQLPGFGTDYITFLTPGIAVMTAAFSAGWSGMGSTRTSTGAYWTGSWSPRPAGPRWSPGGWCRWGW